MPSNLAQKQFPFHLDLVVRRRLGRTLLFCLLSTALVPSTILGIVGYRTADHRLQQAARRHVLNMVELKRLDLQVRVDRHPRGDAGNGGGSMDIFGGGSRVLDAGDGGPAGWRTYLLDADLALVAGNTGRDRHGSGIIVETDLTRRWLRERRESADAMPPAEPRVYAGPTGEPVLGTAAEIRLGGAPYLLVVEMAAAAADGGRNRLRWIWLAVTVLAAAGALLLSLVLAKRVVAPVDDLSQRLAMAAKGAFGHDDPLTVGHEIDALSRGVADIIDRLSAVTVERDAQARLMLAVADLQHTIGSHREPGDLGLMVLERLSAALDLVNSGFFTLRDDGGPTCVGRYPGHPDDGPQGQGHPRNGWAAQAVRRQTVMLLRRDVDGGLLSEVPKVAQANFIVVPLMGPRGVNGVLELEKTRCFGSHELGFTRAAAAVVACSLDTALARQGKHRHLERAPDADALKAREAALRAQSRAFRAAEEKLQLKQLELEAANAQMMKNAADLEAHMAILQKQKKEMQKQNAELEKTHRELEEKARLLEMSSRYKTEFMANMSHELRTPLNSILLLSRLLMENKDNTLTPRQSEFAKTVHAAGEDLLNLINEILDLAKVEAGKMEVELAPVSVRAVTNALLVGFTPLAEQKGIAFSVHVDPEVPEQITTDRKRLEQIVKNFLSNAFKFTSQGSVRLEIALSQEAGGGDEPETGPDNAALSISVVDTGIGIPASKHQMVFEAFQQVDGSTRRKYGGTGLGLSISRELARILGGRITLLSEDGHGSRFTLHLPVAPLPENEPAIVRSDAFGTAVVRSAGSPRTAAEPESPAEPVPDDRNRLTPGDRSVLVIDADASTTEPIKTAAYRHGYKVLVAEQFPTGLHFADYYLPAVVFFNLGLQGAGGWQMLSRIKANPRNRHTPVFTMSTAADECAAAVKGAAGHVRLPLTAEELDTALRRLDTLGADEPRHVLVVAPDAKIAARIAGTINIPAVHTRTAAAPDAAEVILNAETMHAVILHPAVDAPTQRAIIDSLRHHPVPTYHYSGIALDPLSPVTAGPLEPDMRPRPINTPDQLLLALVSDLHMPPAMLDPASRRRLQAMDHHRNVLKGRTILLVDDDMRTVFAVSNALEDQGAVVRTGKTGKESLDKMDGFPDIDLVLMDVMISEVDGYQAIRDIRSRDRYRTLPIIALTARAMQGDRAKCLQAGANDYLAKPVNLDKLTSMLKIWLEPTREAAPDAAGPPPG